MSTPLLATKLYVPPPRPEMVPRLRLLQRLDEGLRLGHRLTLISAPAGFGKTTLVAEWVRSLSKADAADRITWLSLDEDDNDLARFLVYFVAALQTIEADIGKGVLSQLQSPQPPAEDILTFLINVIATLRPDRPRPR
jgi:LuxR family maltose regulon positive regulatory protein